LLAEELILRRRGGLFILETKEKKGQKLEQDRYKTQDDGKVGRQIKKRYATKNSATKNMRASEIIIIF